MKAYRFRIGPFIFILNVRYSTIGSPYPRIFIAWPNNTYSNLELTLGLMIPMTEEDWFSWLDDELIELDDIQKVKEIGNLYGVNIDHLTDWAFDRMTAASFK